MSFEVKFDTKRESISVAPGHLITEAAKLAGLEILQPCGGQGRCGRCTVQVTSGNVRRRSSLRLSSVDVEQGYALACQTVIESNISVSIPPQEQIEKKLVSDRRIGDIEVPSDYDFYQNQSLRAYHITLDEPNLEDKTDDLSRLRLGIRQQVGIENISVPLPIIQKLGSALRKGDWKVTVYVDTHHENETDEFESWLVDVISGHMVQEESIWGIAIDIGTTTVTVWLVDLMSGKVISQVAQYNAQIARGEDVISRILFSSKDDGSEELRDLVLETINELIKQSCARVKGIQVSPSEIRKATIAGNSTMLHLLLGIPANSIRLAPFITAINQPPLFTAGEIGIEINALAVIDCLPGVASYVGADISAGVYSSGMDKTDLLTLFLDVGTNGEIVLGSREWLVTCACSAGPAFEGAGVLNGMRATEGAIEEVWIHTKTFEPTYRVIGGGKPRGICGSGLISLLAEMFMTGVVDRAGHLNTNLKTKRVREGNNGLEYVVVWSKESQAGEDIIINHVDIDNLIRAKAAIYAGFTVLAQSVGIPLELTEQVLIGGSFGKYINIEKAIQIGLLPDMPWERYRFLGNTSVKGAYYALLDREAHRQIKNIASKMTYIELSADNTFYDAFMSAMFLPHTNLDMFPTIKESIMEPNN